MDAKYIGPANEVLLPDSTHSISVVKFTGKRYKPGKDAKGKWLDTVGEPDDRFMVSNPSAYTGLVPYTVYASASEVLKDWTPSNWNDQQAHSLKQFI